MRPIARKIIATIFCLMVSHLLFSQFELIKKNGHAQAKSAIDISRGGKYFLSIDGSMKCLIWDVATGAQVNVLYDVYRAKFAADGESIYIVSRDKKFRRVDLAGKTLETLSTTAYKTEGGESTIFFPEDDLFLAKQDLFSLKNGFQKKLNLGKENVFMQDYLPAQKLLMVSNDWESISFYTLPGVAPAGSLKIKGGVSFSNDGSKILAASSPSLQVFSKASGALLRTFQVPAIAFAMFDPGGTHVIWGSQFGNWENLTVAKAEISSGKIIWQRTLTIDRKYNSTGFGFGSFGKISPDGSTLLVSSQESDQFAINAKTGAVTMRFKNIFPGSARSVMLNPEKTELSMYVGKKITYWNMMTGTLDKTIDVSTTILELDRSDQVFYDLESGKSDTWVKKDKNGKVLKKYPSARYMRSGFGGRYEMLEEWTNNIPCDRNAGASSEALKIVDAQTGKPVFSKTCWIYAAMANTKPVVAIAELPGGQLSFYNYLTGEKLYTIASRGSSKMHFSSDDKYLVVTGPKNSIEIADLETRQVSVADNRALQVDANKGYFEILGFTPDSRFAVLRYAFTFSDGPGTVTFLNLATGKPDRMQTPTATVGSMHTNIAFLKDGRFMLMTGENGTVSLYDRTSNKIAATLYPFEETGDWAVLAPNGLFDASNGAQNTMYYKAGSNIAPLSTVFEKYYTPKLFTRILNGEQFEPVPDINKLKAIPVVQVQYMEGTRNLVVEDEADRIVNTNKTTGTVVVKADCPSDKVTEIRLYQNGKLVETTRNLTVEDDKNGQTLTRSFNVTLTAGSNVFKAVALNSERSESKPALINAKLTPEKKPDNPVVRTGMRLHLVVVGINNYKNPKYNLNYAQADAASFKNAVEAGGKEIFSSIITYYVQDNQATKEGIQSALDKVKQNASAEDLLIFYYAGHGVLDDKKEFYLVPHDVTQLYGNDESLARTGISSAMIQQYSKEIRAQKQLFILDACQSAGALNNAVAMRGAAEEKAIAQLARSTGTHWLTASGSDQFAAEFSQLGHGSFTYCLLQAMKGEADNGDKKLTVKEIDSYLQNKVPEITQKYKGSAQYPASFGYGNDFPIVIIK